MVNPVYLLAQMLWRNWWIIAICILASLNGALLAVYSETPLYRVSTTFVVYATSSLQTNQDVFDSLGTLDDRNRSVLATYAEILGSRNVSQAAGEALQFPSDQLEAYDVSVVVLPSANMLKLNVTGPEPGVATVLANTIGHQGIGRIGELYPIHDINQLDPAVIPSQPISPRPLRDTILGVFLGVVIGVVLMIMREQILHPGSLFANSPIMPAVPDALQQVET